MKCKCGTEMERKGHVGEVRNVFWCPECGILCITPGLVGPSHNEWFIPSTSAWLGVGDGRDSKGDPLSPEVLANLNKHFPYGKEPGNSYAIESVSDRTCVKCGKCCALSFIHLNPDQIAHLASAKDGRGESYLNAVFMTRNWVSISETEAKARGVNHGPFSYPYSCAYLMEDGTCGCYDKRPPICYGHPKANQSLWASCVFARTEAEKEAYLAKKACLADTVGEEEKAPRIRHIVNGSIKKNPRAGQTEFLLPGKTDTVVNDDGSATSTRNVSRVYSMVPAPEYLYIYEPMYVNCVHCLAKFPIDDLGDDYYVEGDDEVPVSDICPMCKTPDSVEEEIRYETISEALARQGGLK